MAVVGMIVLMSGGLLPAPAKAQPALPQLPFATARAVELLQEWAQTYRLEPSFKNSLGMQLVLIPGGRFDMGPNGSKYRVMLSRPYFLGTTEVTLGQYRKFKPGHRIDGA